MPALSDASLRRRETQHFRVQSTERIEGLSIVAAEAIAGIRTMEMEDLATQGVVPERLELKGGLAAAGIP